MGNQQSLFDSFDTLIHGNNYNDYNNNNNRSRSQYRKASTSSFSSNFQSAFHFNSTSRQHNPKDCCALWKAIKSILGIWSTGNTDIDEIIKETRSTVSKHRKPWKWITYDKFEDVKFIAKGGYGHVSSAWCTDTDVYGRVALKSLDCSENISKEYLQKLRDLAKFERSGGVIRIYGMTQDPETNNYMLVMKHAKCNLRQYINKYYNTLSLSNKIELLVPISNGIKKIHQANLVHGDFHPGNILQTLINNPTERHFSITSSTKIYSTPQTWSYISDLGLIGPASNDPRKILNEKDDYVDEPEIFDDLNLNTTNDNNKFHSNYNYFNEIIGDDENDDTDVDIIFEFKEKQDSLFSSYKKHYKVYGVLPYVAPEVLRGQKYTQAADVYAFGFIMYEVFMGHPPYHDVPHDFKLAQKICTGHRPSISSSEMPHRVMKLITSCWDSKPEERPSAQELHNTIRGWYWRLDPEMKSLMRADDEAIRGSRSGTPIKEISGFSTPQTPGTPNTPFNFQSTPFTTPLNTSISQTYSSVNANLASPLSTTSTISLGGANEIEIHPEAIFISRLLEFENLPQTASWYY